MEGEFININFHSTAKQNKQISYIIESWADLFLVIWNLYPRCFLVTIILIEKEREVSLSLILKN